MFYWAIIIQRNLLIPCHLFYIVQAPFGIRWPILNKPLNDDRFLGLEIFLEELFLGKGFLPRYLFKIQLQNFKEFETTKLVKAFEMDGELNLWRPIYLSPWPLRSVQFYVLVWSILVLVSHGLLRLFKIITQTEKHITWRHWNKSRLYIIRIENIACSNGKLCLLHFDRQ